MLLSIILKREIGNKFPIKKINLENHCNKDHKYGYAPFVQSGMCRICMSNEPIREYLLKQVNNI